MSKFHIVFRPRLESIPEFNDFKIFISSYCTSYIVSAEKGNSKGSEEYNHFDAVVFLKKEVRNDSFKRTLCKKFNITGIEAKNVVVNILDNDRIDYYIGYCMKEGIFSDTNFSVDQLEKGKNKYESCPKLEPKKVKFATVNEVAIEYNKWLWSFNEDVTESLANGYWNHFMGYFKKYMQFSTYQRINKEKLIEYVCLRDRDEL